MEVDTLQGVFRVTELKQQKIAKLTKQLLCEAARINLQLEHGIDLGGDQIARWLGVSHILC